jgi:hypothetical protein
MKIYTENELLTIRDREESWLKSQTGITGTGICLGNSGNPCLRIFASEVSESTKMTIEKKLSDVPIAWSEGEMIAY